VTLGHVIQGVIYKNAGFYEDGLFKAIYLFHMPLFMALAGYTAFGSLQRAIGLPFIARRAVNLLLPVFTRTLIGYVAIFGIFSLKDFPSALATLGNLFFGSVWFFWALFFSQTIVATAKKFQIDNFLCAICSLLLILLLIPEAHNMYLFKFTLPFFWIGYFAAKYPETWRIFTKSKSFLVAAFCGAFASYFLWDDQTYIYVSGMTLTSSNLGTIFFRFAAGVLASVVALWIFHRMDQRFFPKFFGWLGTRSLFVFILQSYLFAGLATHAHKLFLPAGWRGTAAGLLGIPLALLLATGLALVSQWMEKPNLIALFFFGRLRRPAS